MRYLAVSLCVLGALGAVQAGELPGDAGLAEVGELGRLNGQALACAQSANIARIKAVMINHAPKSRRYGEAFEQATQAGFSGAHQPGCPDAAALARRVEETAARLQTLFPASERDERAAGEADQPAPGAMPRYLLMDARGRAVSGEDFPGRYQLISFGYTFCPDICPTTLAEVSLILDKLGALSERVQPIFITLDPERDSAEVLSRYTAYFHPRILGLGGPPELVRRAADHFRVRYEKHREPGAAADKYTVDHSAGMYLVGPDGRFITRFAYATPPADIAARIRFYLEHDAGFVPQTAGKPEKY